MATRKEIREVIDAYADDSCLYPDIDCEFRKVWCISGEGAYKCLMKRLDELGVVIKGEEVENETPIRAYSVEPLIEDS